MQHSIPDAIALEASVTGRRILPSGNAKSGRTLLGIELSGCAMLTEDDAGFGGRSWHTVTGSVARPEVQSAPELFVRVPVDEDLGDFLKVIVGLRFAF